MMRTTQWQLSALLCVLLTMSGSHTSAAVTHEWRITSRHGECHVINEVLRRRFDDLPEILSPEAFIDTMRARGIPVTVSNAAGSGNDAFVVEIPSYGMSLIFVPLGSCVSENRQR